MPDRVSPSLVEAAARAMREWGVPGTDGGLTILAEEVLVAVGDALRLEGAQAEHARCVGAIKGAFAPILVTDKCAWWAQRRALRALRALGGVHPEAWDG